MSETLLLTGQSNVLECTFSPPIALDVKKTHYIGLVEFVAYNSIPNIDNSNNVFNYDNNKIITFDRGSYEIESIEALLKQRLGDENISLKPNNSTLKCKIKSKFKIDFSKSRTIGRLLGFGSRFIWPPEEHESDLPVNIMSVNMVCVECNIATGSYVKGKIAHNIFAFRTNVPPGYKMSLSPRTIFYNRINTPSIERLRLDIVDQEERPVDFGGEEVSILLHIKSDG